MIALLLLADLLSEANAAREAGRSDEAVRLYQRTVAANPSATEAWWYLGLLLYEKEHHAEAAGAFAKVAAQQPKHGAGWAMLGMSQYRQKRYDEALTSLRKAQSFGVPPLNNLDKIARYHLTVLLNRAGEHDLSSGLLMSFVTDNAVTPLVTKAAGIAALRLRMLPEEIPADRIDAVSLAGEASILAWQKRAGDARTKAAALLERYPKLPNAHYLMGYVLSLENDPAAIREFEKEIEQDNTHVPARLQIAYEFFRTGEVAKALSWAQEAVHLAPGSFVAQDIYGRILLGVDRPAEAVKALEVAVKLAPESPEAHFHLATAYTRAGRRQDAARHREIYTRLEGARKQ